MVSATSAKWTKTKRRPRTIKKATLARHKRFVAEYVIDHNGARAARAAGYAKRTANVMASQLLARADVQQLVVEAEAEIRKTTKMTAEGILVGVICLNAGDRDELASSSPGPHVNVQDRMSAVLLLLLHSSSSARRVGDPATRWPGDWRAQPPSDLTPPNLFIIQRIDRRGLPGAGHRGRFSRTISATSCFRRRCAPWRSLRRSLPSGPSLHRRERRCRTYVRQRQWSPSSSEPCGASRRPTRRSGDGSRAIFSCLSPPRAGT